MNFLKGSSAFDYYQKIKSGEIKAPHKIFQMFNLIESIYEKGLIRYDKKLGQLPISFIETLCKHSKGKWAGQDIKLELWQKVVINLVYGILENKSDKRHFQRVLLIVGRKNGKSLLASGISLFSLMADGVKGAEVYMIATQKDQARIVFDGAKNMIKQSPELKKLLKVRQFLVEHPDTLSTMKPLATEGSAKNSLDGWNPSNVILDEIHAYDSDKKINEMSSGMGSRDEPLLWMITTAGHIRNGAYDNQYDLSKQILSGSTDLKERMLPIIYELDDKSQWDEPDEWIKANPNLEVSKSTEYLEKELSLAKSNPATKNEFLTKHCNFAVNSEISFLELDEINKNKDLNFKLEEFKKLVDNDQYGYSYPCFVGIDLSQKLDLTAVSFMFRKPNDDVIYIHTQAFMAEEQLMNNLGTDKGSAYDIWRDDGWIITNPGNVIDYNFIFDYIVNTIDKYNLNPWKIGIDDWGSSYIKDKLIDYGFKDQLVSVRQGAKTLSVPMQELKGHIMDGKLNFQNNPVYKWNLINVIEKRDNNGNIKPDKTKKEQRIDLFASSLNAFVVYMENPDEYNNFINDL